MHNPTDNTNFPADQNHQTETPAHEVPIHDPNAEDELECDLLTCVDIEDQQHLQGNNNMAWRFEIDCELRPQNQPYTEKEFEEIIYLATTAKKQRTEVKLSQLTPAEREEFDRAKAAEIANWLSTGTVCRVLRNQLSPEQVLRCRWIYTWKPIESAEEQAKTGKNRKAKARLVVLGYLDPALEEIPRDSPTLNRQSRMLILQLISSMNWMLMSFDIKAAFLQGSTQGRVIGIDPPPEMIKAMKLSSTETCQLSKSAYGLIDAPFLWFQELDKALRELSFKPSPFDPTVYLLYPEGATEPAGIIGVHVDDGLCGGNEFFHDTIGQTRRTIPVWIKKESKLCIHWH